MGMFYDGGCTPVFTNTLASKHRRVRLYRIKIQNNPFVFHNLFPIGLFQRPQIWQTLFSILGPTFALWWCKQTVRGRHINAVESITRKCTMDEGYNIQVDGGLRYSYPKTESSVPDHIEQLVDYLLCKANKIVIDHDCNDYPAVLRNMFWTPINPLRHVRCTFNNDEKDDLQLNVRPFYFTFFRDGQIVTQTYGNMHFTMRRGNIALAKWMHKQQTGLDKKSGRQPIFEIQEYKRKGDFELKCWTTSDPYQHPDYQVCSSRCSDQ